VYIRQFSGSNFIVLLLYVDDVLIVGQDAILISKLKDELSKSFDMKDLAPARYIFGIDITRDRKTRNYGYHKKNMLNECLKSST